jgi:ABC-type molybdate transport system substrate-binding protein
VLVFRFGRRTIREYVDQGPVGADIRGKKMTKASSHGRALLAAALAAVVSATPLSAAEDAGHNKDYRTFHAGGNVEYGKIADSYTADLVLYLAGNQFMVMEELIRDFQAKNPDIKTVYVETIPPGQIFKGQILKQGQINGQNTAMNPDVFASVNLGHLKSLAGKGIMDEYMVYTHNKLELMVAEGNPKGIKGPEDLARDDLVQSHPNPLTEGIFRFYGAAMLKDMGLYEKVTGNAECRECWAIEGKTWFTARHHRETPDRIEKGQADVGIVWTTEIIEAKKHGRRIDGVAIPAPLNKSDVVGYAIGALKTGRNQQNASRYLEYLTTDEAQHIYAKYGFVKASAGELKLRPIPAP